MGMTLWIHTLEDRDYSKDSDDHSLMHDLADQLDEVCEELNVQKLTEFFDFTDLEYSYTEEYDGDEDEEENEELDSELDSETDLEYGIDDMQWFDASRGLATLIALREHIKTNSLTSLSDDEENDLLDELEDCITKLEDTAPRGGKFHLSVVE